MPFPIKLISGLLLLANLISAQAALPAADEVSLNFVNAEIDAVVKAVAEISGRNFILDPRVKGTVNIVSGRPVPRALAYDILLAGLRMQGFAAVENGAITRVVPEAEARTQAPPMRTGNSGGGQLVTQVFVLRFESASQMLPVLRPLVSPNNAIGAHPAGNALIVTDYADNLKRIAALIEAIDLPQADAPVVFRLQHASALELAHTLSQLLMDTGSGGSDPGQRVTVIPEPRTNSLLVRTSSPGRLTRIRGLIENLDSAAATEGNLHVVYLKNADAAHMARTLRAILSADGGGAPAAVSPGAVTTAAASGGGPGGGPATAALAASHGELASGSRVQADVAANALIITAPAPLYRDLRRVIDQLDKRRAQVYVEALIVELTAERASEFGIQWQAFARDGRVAGVAGTNFGNGGQNILGLVTNLGQAGASGSLGVAPGLNLAMVNGSLGVLLRALENDSRANILSTPNLVTLDNEEARIVIGQNLPFVTGQYAQTGSAVTATPFQTIERRDVGLTIRIRPQISEGGAVRLGIYQEVSTVQPQTVSNTNGPVTNKRTIESTVLIDDGAILVLGGLMEDNAAMGEDKVPLLGDIPGLGGLFRYENRRRAKTNLMVFLRPVILRDATASARFSADRYDYVIGQQQRAIDRGRGLAAEAPFPVLPPRDRAAGDTP